MLNPLLPSSCSTEIAMRFWQDLDFLQDFGYFNGLGKYTETMLYVVLQTGHLPQDREPSNPFLSMIFCLRVFAILVIA